MKNKFVTLAELNYAHAHYLKKELQREKINAFIDFCVSDRNWVKLQVQEERVKDSISELFKIADRLGQNPLKDISQSNYEDTPLILVPVRLDDHSFELGKHAITFAKRVSAEIKFLHVYFESNEAFPQLEQNGKLIPNFSLEYPLSFKRSNSVISDCSQY